MMDDKEHVIRYESKKIFNDMKNNFDEINRKYPEGMDLECVALSDAINLYPGIATLCSCCGHGKTDYSIYYRVTNMESLAWIIFHTSYLDNWWRTEVTTEGTASEISFRLRSVKDPTKYAQQIYEEAQYFANNLLATFDKFVQKHLIESEVE